MLEFVLGVVFAWAAFLFAEKHFVPEISKPVLKPFKTNQSHTYELVKFSYVVPLSAPLRTQATEFHDKNSVRILVVEDKAYWIKNQRLYVADYIDLEIQESSTKVVDTMAMDDVELKKIIFVIDKLNEGKNHDSGNPGDKSL